MSRKNRILVFLLILILEMSINGQTILAASISDYQDADSDGETVIETENTDWESAKEETEPVEITEPVVDTEPIEEVPETVFQQETEEAEETEEIASETETESTEPEIKGYAGMSLASQAGRRKLLKAASAASGAAHIRNSGYIRTDAIDVSEFNTVTDWSKVKASGVQAVIIRVAGRYIGSGNIFDDDNFAANVQGAKKAGLQVGVYFFSQALNEKEAIEEADYAAQKMAAYKSSITLPVYMDYEWDNSAYRLYNGGSVAQRTATVKAFMTEIKKKGYTAGLYASDNVLGNYLNSNSISDTCSIWIAHWGVSAPGSDYTGVYDCWQYSSSGAVPGIEGTIDLNYYYMPPAGGSWNSENISGKEGIYIISSVADPGHALEVGSDGNLTLGNYTAANNQRFILTSDSAGRYEITSFLNGKVLDRKSGGTLPGTNIWTYKKNGTNAQKWLLQKAGSETFYITAYNSGNRITVDSSLNVELGGQDNSKKYEFILNRVSSEEIAEGWYEIPVAASSSFVLDIQGGSYADKANCQIYIRNGTNAQKFFIEKTADGYYRMMCAKNGKVLDVSGGNTSDYVNIQQYSSNGTDAQKWIILKNDDDSFSFFAKKSLKSLSVDGSLFNNSSNVFQIPYVGDAGQKFKITARKTDSGALIPEGKYYIVSAGNTGYAVEVEDGKRTDSANVRLNTKKSVSSQQFIFVYLGNGYYSLMNDNSGKALDVKGGSINSQANIQQYHANGTGAQIWKIQKNSDGTYSFINQKSSKSLDVAGGKYQEKTNIWQYNQNGTKAQKFYLKRE